MPSLLWRDEAVLRAAAILLISFLKRDWPEAFSITVIFASAMADSHFLIISVIVFKLSSVPFTRSSFFSLSTEIMLNPDSIDAIFSLISCDLLDISSSSLERDSERALSSSILSVFTLILLSFLSIFARVPDKICFLSDMFSSSSLIFSR